MRIPNSLLCTLGLAAVLFPAPVKAATLVWDDAVALYAFNQNLSDSNGASSGTSWQRSSNSEVVPVFVATGSSSRPGWNGYALSLADTRYVSLGQGGSDALQITGSLTLFARVNVTTGGGDLAIISKDGAAGNRSYAMRLENISETGGTLTTRFNGSATVSYTSATLATGAWLDLAVVYEAGGRIELYINGESVNTVSSGVPSVLLNNTTTPLLLGAQPIGTPIGASNWTGLMERAAIWNTALTDEQVRSLSVIPEPGSVALLAGGFCILAWAGVHRAHKTQSFRFFCSK